MIHEDDQARFRTLLVEMRALHDQLDEHQAGLCVLHLDAAIAALEGHLKREGLPLAQCEVEPARAADQIG